MLLKISLRNHLKALSFHLLGTLAMVIVLWLLKFDNDIAFIFTIFWIIYTIPALFLHIEYWLCNGRETYTIINNEITRTKDGKKTTYNTRDIKEVIVYMAPNVIKGNNFRYLPMESYYYGRIKTKNGQELVITSLLTRDIRDIFKKLNVDKYFEEERMFCTLSMKD